MTADFCPEQAEPVLQDVVQRLALGGRGLRLMRWGENLTYHLVGTDVVVRLRRPTLPLGDTLAELAFAGFLAAHNFPAVRSLPMDGQPIHTPLGPVTFWRYEESRPGNRDEHGKLAALLRDLHRLPQPADAQLRAWTPLGKVPQRVATLRVDPAVPRWALDVLEAQAAAVGEATADLEPDPAFGWRVCHGDGYMGNVLVRDDGTALFCDLEGGCLAPAEWDLSEVMTGKRRFGLPTAQWDAFVESYGVDPFSSRNAAIMLRARELASTSWLLQQAGTSEAVREEGLMRVRSIRDDDYSVIWSAF